jgi:hypothetical protein
MPQDRRVAAESPLEIFLAENGDVRQTLSGWRQRAIRRYRLRQPVVVSEIASQDDPRPEQAKRVGRDVGECHVFGRAIVMCHNAPEGLDAGGILDGGRSVALEIEIVRCRPEVIVDVALLKIGAGIDQAVGILIRQWAQKHGVSHAEDGGARADSQGEGEHGGCRESGT